VSESFPTAVLRFSLGFSQALRTYSVRMLSDPNPSVESLYCLMKPVASVLWMLSAGRVEGLNRAVDRPN